MPRTSRAAVIVAAVLIAGTIPVAGLHADGSETVPCTDPRGCPDLTILEDPETVFEFPMDPFLHTETFEADDCAVQEGQTEAGTRRLLKFNTTTGNVGAGDVVIGSPSDHPQWFEHADCHGHMHFESFAAYRLWTPSGFDTWDQLRRDEPEKLPGEILDDHPELRDEFVAGHKQGFCIIDTSPIVANLTQGPPKYTSCDLQGLSAGHADTYNYGLTGQWIDVTDVPDGTYVVELETDPGGLFEETTRANNRAWTTVQLGPGLHADPPFHCTDLVLFGICGLDTGSL